MGRHTTTVRGRVSHDQHSSDSSVDKTTFSGDGRCEAHFPIERAKRCLDVADRRLYLDDEKRPPERVPRKYVDRASLAVDGEGCLGDNVPAIRHEEGHDLLDETGMRGVDQSVEGCPRPLEPEHDPRTEGCGHAFQRFRRNGRQLAELDSRDLRLRAPASHGQVLLTPAAALAEGADALPEPDPVHGASLAPPTPRSRIRP
jgi:hypothetical protein